MRQIDASGVKTIVAEFSCNRKDKIKPGIKGAALWA
jgi:hypothetical protein